MNNSQSDTVRPLLDELKERGMLQDASHPEALSDLLEKKPLTFYCGFDPTAESLHVGSLLPLVTIKRFLARGHHAIILLGSATGMIGDPSGKSKERLLLSEEVLENNISALHSQITSILADDSTASRITFVENASWLRPLSYIDILRDVGKDFSVNYMMGKDSVKSRLTERDQGISYTEFSYMLLQAYDFNYLYKNHNCRLQIGGSDQWGNITAGLDYIRKKNEHGEQAFALTFPLVTNADGRKFGKSESGNIWAFKRTYFTLCFLPVLA
jgi:tyrosyl-tRNA synthetase